MQLSTKKLAHEINKSLDEIGVPENSKERLAIFSRMLDIPRQQAWSILEGQSIPDEKILEKITNELEIDPHAVIN
ncbi:MAG: hypothetical protein JO131_04095 [Gammaproteobacteria bacterium]|nr:hypothetical protein [Gammaproteobacteria bacterium]